MYRIIFLICLFFLFVSSSFAQEVGKITGLHGKVDVLREGKIPAVEAKLNQSVHLKDIIRTKSGSTAEITFNDGTVVKIAQRSRIDISEYFTDGDSLKTEIFLQRGKIGANVSKVSVNRITKSPEANRFQIKTPVAVAGVRGTNFIVSHDTNFVTTILVITGKVYAYNLNYPDKIIDLKDGELTIIKQKSLPTSPIPAAPEDISRYQASLSQSPDVPLTERKLIKIKHYCNIDSNLIWKENLQQLENTQIKAKFYGNAFWIKTPAVTRLDGQIIDPTEQLALTSSNAYLWSGNLKGRGEKYYYLGYIGGTISPKLDDSYNMNAYLTGIYRTSSNNKGIFIGYLGNDGSSNISLNEKIFSLEGQVLSSLVLGKGSITENLAPTTVPMLTILESSPANLTITNQLGEYFFDTCDENYSFGVGILGLGGNYDSSQDNWYLSFQSAEDGKFFGGVTIGSLWGEQNNVFKLLKGKTYGYFVNSDNMNQSVKTGLIFGETIGTDPVIGGTYTWQTITPFVMFETNKFLEILSNESERQKLSSLGIPVVEIGRDTLSYSASCTNCITSLIMSNVRFFANSLGSPPTIWATNQVAGTFNGNVTVGSQVNLSGNTISATFKINKWESNYWISTISGSGTLGDFTISRMDGYAAGKISGNTFSGTASGIVKAEQ